MTAGSAEQVNRRKWKCHLHECIDEAGFVPVQWLFCP
eukprot:COSAG02_NODE_57713_length_279_cov_1.711111_1_plen_36_part_01